MYKIYIKKLKVPYSNDTWYKCHWLTIVKYQGKIVSIGTYQNYKEAKRHYQIMIRDKTYHLFSDQTKKVLEHIKETEGTIL